MALIPLVIPPLSGSNCDALPDDPNAPDLRQHSRGEWLPEYGELNVVDSELQTGCLQRIADALERLADAFAPRPLPEPNAIAGDSMPISKGA